MIPLSHSADLNMEHLKSYFKDSPVCLDLAYFQPRYKIEKWLFNYFWSSLHFLNYAVNSLVKSTSIIHFKFMERRPRDNKIS